MLIIASFVVTDGPDKKNLIPAIALIPVAAYGSAYASFVVFLKKWPDFYGFTFGGNPVLSVLMAIGIILVAWGLATLLVKAKKHF